MSHPQRFFLRLFSSLSLLCLIPAPGLTQSAKLFQDLNKTVRNIPVNPMPASSDLPWDSRRFVHLGQRLILSAKSSATGQELYVTDGTKAGTQLVKDIQFGATSSNPRMLFLSQDGKTVFFVTDGTDKTKTEELWVTDGTVKGVQLIHQSLSFDSLRFPQSLELSNAMLWTLGN